MPTVWDQALYDQAYRIRIKNPADPQVGQHVSGYGRQFASNYLNPGDGDWTRSRFYEIRIAQMQGILGPGLTANSRVLIVGAAFGFTVEQLIAFGIANVWGTDISQWIADNIVTEADPAIAPRLFQKDITDADAQSFFQTNTGTNGKFNVIVTDDVLSSYDPATEAAALTAFFDACETLLQGNQLDRVVHLATSLEPDETLTPSAADPNVTDGGRRTDLGITWLSLADWKALRPAHTFVNSEGWAVL